QLAAYLLAHLGLRPEAVRIDEVQTAIHIRPDTLANHAITHELTNTPNLAIALQQQPLQPTCHAPRWTRQWQQTGVVVREAVLHPRAQYRQRPQVTVEYRGVEMPMDELDAILPHQPVQT